MSSTVSIVHYVVQIELDQKVPKITTEKKI